MILPCPLCSHSETRLLSESHTEDNVSYTLHECPACAAQFWSPFQNPGAAWYEKDERYANRNQDPILTPNKKHKDVLAYFKRKTGKVLDIGCGVGNFLAYAAARGWEAWGIDFDHDAITSGIKTFGLQNLEVGDLGEFRARHSTLKFELLTFFDVFEHIDNHNEFIEHAKALLTQDGYVALSVPYRHSWRWLVPCDLPPRHLTRWDEESLRTFLLRHGLEVCYSTRLPASIYYIAMKLRFKYGAWTSLGLVQKTRTQIQAGKPSEKTGTTPLRVKLVQILAKAKDLLLFGLPAVCIWLVLFCTRKRYTDITLIAQRKS